MSSAWYQCRAGTSRVRALTMRASLPTDIGVGIRWRVARTLLWRVGCPFKRNGQGSFRPQPPSVEESRGLEMVRDDKAVPLLPSSGVQSSEPSLAKLRSPRSFLAKLVDSLGSGLMVCLADTDGGCLVTAAQSGARYGYSLLLTQLLLIPILYWAQELTVRLGVVKRCGITEMVRHTFGLVPAWLCCALLLVTCLGATISEMSMVAAAGKLWGVPRWLSCAVVVFTLTATIFSGSLRRLELIGLFFGGTSVSVLDSHHSGF